MAAIRTFFFSLPGMSEAKMLGQIHGRRLAAKAARKRFAKQRASILARHKANPDLVWTLDGQPVPFDLILKYLDESERQFLE